MDLTIFDLKQGLLKLPGEPETWIWAFTCPTPACSCRMAIVLSAPCSRQTLHKRGQPVADAWLAGGVYSRAAHNLPDVTAFAMDIDTRELGPVIGDGDALLDVQPPADVQMVVRRFDDDIMDTIARLWHIGKAEDPPPDPGAGGAKLEVEGWAAGELLLWDYTVPDLRTDRYPLDCRMFEAVEFYCVAPNCDCSQVAVDFSAIVPRGAPDPGVVEFNDDGPILYPTRERQRARLAQLWTAYCDRHRDYQERFAKRGALMHARSGQIVAAPPKSRVSRNAPCPCGSRNKYKKCCGAV